MKTVIYMRNHPAVFFFIAMKAEAGRNPCIDLEPTDLTTRGSHILGRPGYQNPINPDAL